MARTTTTTIHPLATLQAALMADPDALTRSRDELGGSAAADLAARMHAADPRCVVCGLPTVRMSGARKPEAMRMLVLIPCAMLDEAEQDVAGIERRGWVPGNVAIACHACIADSTREGVATGEPVVFTADALTLPDSVWLSWPKGLGSKRRGRIESDRWEASRLARQALGLTF